ncbi:MAG TPA: dihydroorotate dehydrogenase electron transfer subunit [Actinomycetota bacterium]|nr:dihydroorotate dehydrogenase electron transfer subunit [Actinomycetota bacterium]
MILTTGEVLSHKKYGEHFHSLTIVAPEIGSRIKPGQFVNVRCGESRSHIIRRPFSVYRVHKRGGWASTIELVFDIRGPGSLYLSQLRGHAMVDLLGPLGRGFQFPKRRAHCLLIGGGIGATPLFFLADELRNDGHRVDVILGARDVGLLLNPIEVRRLASVSVTTTEDGSAGVKGRVTDVLAETIERCATEIVYTCGPNPMMAAVSRIATAHKVPVQVAVEELMGCGYGVCMTCVMPLRRKKRKDESPDEAVVYARSCTEGPVFNGAAVIWNGSAEPVGADEAELAPASAASRGSALPDPADEFPPPGN